MKGTPKLLRWAMIAAAAVLSAALGAAIVAIALVTSRLNRTYDVQAQAVTIPDDPAAVERGEHLVRAVAGCDVCHGTDLGGMTLLEEPLIMSLYGPNLTAGEGGVGARFSDLDWERALRHGVDTDGKPLILMPAQNFRWLTDEDLGAIVAYLRSLRPVDNAVPEPVLGPMGYLLALTEPAFLPAELFDHSERASLVAEPGVTAEYGAYLVAIGTCRDCHGEDLNGRELPLPDEPPARNLTPGGELIGWTNEDFIGTIRTGITPSGHELREPMASVLKTLRRQSDEELTAIFFYLQSLPTKEFGAE